MENEQKMPTGMKVILVFLYFGLVGEVIAVFINGGISIGITVWGIPSSVLTVVNFAILLFLIISIHVRKWWKASAALLGFQLLTSIASYAYMLSLSSVEFLNLTRRDLPLPTGVNAEQLATMTKQFMMVFGLVGVIMSIIIFIYVYKHRVYFNKG